jgi:RimJ/RimL family protein N-acetyltransferase
MEVQRYTDVEAFRSVVAPLLAADPVRNTITATILADLGSTDPAQPPLLLVVRDGDAVVGQLVQTPPWPVVATGVPAEVAPAVVDQLRHHGLRPPGATGLRPQVDALAAAWSAASGDPVTVETELRLFRLGQLISPDGVPGAATVATEADAPVLAAWSLAFTLETTPQHTHRTRAADEAGMRATLRRGQHRYLVWRVGGEPVSMARATAPGVGVSRIGPVYTPPEHRGHGYAAGATAAAAAWALGSGAEEVVLFTDLANPTTNALYPRLGFRPVGDAREWQFGTTEGG